MLFYFSPFYLRSQQITRTLAFKSSHAKLAAFNPSKCCFVTSVRALNKNDQSKKSLNKEQPSPQTRSEKLKKLRESGFVQLNSSSSSKLKHVLTTTNTPPKKPLPSAEASKPEKPAETSKPKESPAPLAIDSAVLRLAKLIDNLKHSDVSEKLLKPLVNSAREQKDKSQPKAKPEEPAREKKLKLTEPAQRQIEVKVVKAPPQVEEATQKKPREPIEMGNQRNLSPRKTSAKPQIVK